MSDNLSDVVIPDELAALVAANPDKQFTEVWDPDQQKLTWGILDSGGDPLAINDLSDVDLSVGDFGPDAVISWDNDAGLWTGRFIPQGGAGGRVDHFLGNDGYNASVQEGTALVDATAGGSPFTIPDPAVGKQIVVKKIDASANPVVIMDRGLNNIDGATSYSLTEQYESVTLVADDDQWWVV